MPTAELREARSSNHLVFIKMRELSIDPFQCFNLRKKMWVWKSHCQLLTLILESYYLTTTNLSHLSPPGCMSRAAEAVSLSPPSACRRARPKRRKPSRSVLLKVTLGEVLGFSRQRLRALKG